MKTSTNQFEKDWDPCEKLGNTPVTRLHHMLAQAGAFSLRFTYCLLVGKIFQPYPDGRIDLAYKIRNVLFSARWLLLNQTLIP